MIRKLLQSNRKIFVISISLVIFFGWSDAEAQAVIGARELALGQATTALPNTSWAMFGNPALMNTEEHSLSVYGVRYFGLSEVSDMAASLSYPTALGVIGLGAHRYGFDLFNESRLRLGYKNKFLGFHYGIILNYSHVVQGGEYGSAGALGVDLGVAAPVLSRLWIGARATNVNQPKYGTLNNEKLPRELSFGLSYILSDVALFSTEVYKDIQFPISYRGGVEVRLIDQLMGRVGVTTSPRTYSAGIGYMGGVFSTNIAVQRHNYEVMGYSPAIDFKISW